MKDNINKMAGRISEVQRELYTILYDEGEVQAKLKGSFYKTGGEYPVTGDEVTFQYNPSGFSLIEEVHPRKSVFRRPDQSGHAAGYVKTMKEQVLAANFDYVFITTSLNSNYNLKRITRYITISLQSGATPIVVLTKADLCPDQEKYLEEVRAVSEQVRAYAVCALSGEGMEQLTPYLQPGTTIVLLGSSGVGKSTLVNAMAGQDLMKVSHIREKDGRGRHTTTHRQLIVLPSGVTVIDTPGIRELGMCGVSEGIEDTFSDVTKYFGQCKFSNCKHQTEPGCAIKRAIADGELLEDRWEFYCNLQAESNWAAKKMIRKH